LNFDKKVKPPITTTPQQHLLLNDYFKYLALGGKVGGTVEYSLEVATSP